MAEKKVIIDKPEVGDISQYNFSDNETNFNYINSTSLPKNNDKFQDKDLFTNCVGDELNEAIIEKNLKFSGDSSIKIENLYIANTGVGGTVKNNHVTGWIFSQEAYGGDPTKDGYSTIRDKMKDEWKFYSQGFGNKSEGTDIGNITEVEGTPIVSNFSVDSAAIINNAKKVVQGNIQELKEKYQENSWVIHYNGNQMSFSNAVWGGWEIIDHTMINESTNKAEIKLLKNFTINQFIRGIVEHVEIVEIKKKSPSIQDVFIKATSYE